MAKQRYSEMDSTAAFGLLASALGSRGGGDGDRGNTFPRSDAEDMSCGARFIPSEVTMARRRGEKVTFVTECGPCCWYWKMSDGSRIYHFDPQVYQQIGIANKRKKENSGFKGGAGPCPHCANQHTNGGTITTADL